MKAEHWSDVTQTFAQLIDHVLGNGKYTVVNRREGNLGENVVDKYYFYHQDMNVI